MKEKLCPLCGKPNNCQADTNKKCWCFYVEVPKELLEKVQQDKQNSACICLSCIEKFKAKN